jgi:Hemerythrin HHE cation binding domain
MTTDPYTVDIDAELESMSLSKPVIAFDPNLIAKLNDDHSALIAIFARLQGTNTSELGEMVEALTLLRKTFQAHILTEKVYFYAYLDRLLVNHASVREEAHAVWRDMNEIATLVTHFIHKWISNPPTDKTLPEFLEQLHSTMRVLMARIELESQTLYTLYTETL